jgi:hypothetical protein
MKSFAPPIVIVGLVLIAMFEPLMRGDKIAGTVLLVAVVLSGIITLIGAGARAVRRRRYRSRSYYNNNVDRYR